MLIIFIFSSYQGNLRIFVFEKQLKNNSQTYSTCTIGNDVHDM